MHLPAHEIDQWKRMKSFPCTSLEAAVAAGPGAVTANVLMALGEGLEPVVFVVTTQNFVSVSVKLQEVIFIASRGTADAYDWRIDLDSALDAPIMDHSELHMHRGFLGEALKHADLIAGRLSLDENKDLPRIYTTGHSLGGALAAVLYALYSNPFHYWHHFRSGQRWTPLLHLSRHFHVDCSYTFASPRYGDHTAVHQLPNPYSIVRPTDPVIYVPLRRQGYANGLHEYGTNCDATARRDDGLKSHIIRTLINVFKRRGFSAEHNCSLYREEMARNREMTFYPTLLPPELRSKQAD
jgi:hypothetical protein